MPTIVTAPTIEHHRKPLGIGESRPRLSWVVESAPSGWTQTGAEIEFRSGDRAESVVVEGSGSTLVAWPFAPLGSGDGGAVRVRVCGEEGETGQWSPSTALETGLLDPLDWVATPIGPSWDEDPESLRRPALLRTDVRVDGNIARARLYVTAHGLFRTEINGVRVGDDELAPGWTSYPQRLRYTTYDVGNLLREGDNSIGVMLGDGWYRGRLGFHGGHTNLYGRLTAVLAQLRIELIDGTVITTGTDTSWTCSPAPIVSSGLLEGEHHDARLEQAGWSSPAFAAASWCPASARDIDLSTLVAPDGPPVRCTEELQLVSVDERPDGRVIVDFGQNLVGRVRISVDGPWGHEIVIRHAEVLDASGELCTRPLRGAFSVDRYVLSGNGRENWEPAFTIHGFRYVELTGWGALGRDAAVVARVLHTDMRRTGWFESSDSDLDRLHENVVWSMRGNFVDLPTDCPQRDERLGWTGDIQVFAPTAGFLYDCAGLLTSWLKDVSAEQLPDGTVPWYVPMIPGGEQWTPPRPGAGWGDAAVLVPWSLHEHFGDGEVLRRQYPSARAWSDLQARLAGHRHVWDTGYQLGDWLDPSAPPEDPAHGSTDPHLVASAYFSHSAATIARYGLDDDGSPQSPGVLRKRADAARAGFREVYRSGVGTLTSDSQAAYALAVAFSLFDDDELPTVGEHLVRLVRAADTHLSTGFLGTPILLDALTRVGRVDVAYELLRQRTVPSWLYPVTMGATTIWERWDSMLPNGEVNPGEMTSFNHFAFGSVADWMHRTVAGIGPRRPGWSEIAFRPGYESGLEHAAAEHLTPFGRARIDWVRRDDIVTTTMVVPVGAVGYFENPDGTITCLGHGEHVVIASVRATGRVTAEPPVSR